MVEGPAGDPKRKLIRLAILEGVVWITAAVVFFMTGDWRWFIAAFLASGLLFLPEGLGLAKRMTAEKEAEIRDDDDAN